MARGHLPYDPHSGFLFPRHLDELVATDDPVRFVLEATEQLNLAAFESGGRESGQRPFHPLLMVRLLVWGYANGIYSSRKIATAVRRDVTFMWLAGDCRPSYRAILRFRAEHHLALRMLFEQVLQLCAAAGLVRLGHVALDGTVLKADTSKHKAMSYGRMKQEESRLKAEIEQWFAHAASTDEDEDTKLGPDDDGQSMPQELHRRQDRLKKIQEARERIEEEKRAEQKLAPDESPKVEDKEQRSFADPQARIMPAKRGGFEYGYNAQIAVDEHAGVIVAADLDNRSPDIEHLVEMVESVRTARTLVESAPQATKLTADAGYFSSEKIAVADGSGIELLISPGREGKAKPAPTDGDVFDATHFTYDDEKKQLTCPAGRLLVLTERSEENYVAQDCDGCALQTQCLKPGETKRHIRLVKRRIAGALMRAKMQRPEAKEVYRRRKCVVEPVFGQMKWDRRLRGLSMRGQSVSRSEFGFICAVHNLLKWVASRTAAVLGVTPPLVVAQ